MSESFPECLVDKLHFDLIFTVIYTCLLQYCMTVIRKMTVITKYSSGRSRSDAKCSHKVKTGEAPGLFLVGPLKSLALVEMRHCHRQFVVFCVFKIP